MAGNPLNMTVDTSGRGKSYSPKGSAKKRQSFLGNKAYEGEPDDGIERVYPEMLLPVGKAVGAIGKAAQLGGRLKQAGKGFMESPAVNATKRTVKFPKSAPKSAKPDGPKSPRPATPKTPAPPRFDLAKKFGLTPKQKRAWHNKIGEVPAPKPAAPTPKPFVNKTAPKQGATTHEYHDTFVGPKDPNKLTPAERLEGRKLKEFNLRERRYQAAKKKFMGTAEKPAEKPAAPRIDGQQVETMSTRLADKKAWDKTMHPDSVRKDVTRVPRSRRRSKAEIDAARAANAEALKKSRDAEFEAFKNAKWRGDSASDKSFTTNVLKAGKSSAPKDVKEIFKDITGTYKKGGVVKTKKKPLPFWMKKKGAKSEDKAEGPMKYAKGGMVKGSRGNGCAQRGFK